MLHGEKMIPENDRLLEEIKRLNEKIDRLTDRLDKHITFIDNTYEGLKNPIKFATKMLGGKHGR